MSTPLSPEHVINLIKDLKMTKLYADLHSAALLESQKSHVKIADISTTVSNSLANSGWEKKLRNAVFTHLQQRPSGRQQSVTSADVLKEPIPYIRKAQVSWEKRIVKSVNSMSTELAFPLARQRGDKEQKDLLSKWSELGVFSPDLSQIRPVYAPKDFLEVVISLQNPNFNTARDIGCSSHLGVVQVPLRVKDIHELRFQYSDMSIKQCQTGVDDQGDVPPELFITERTKLAYKVAREELVPVSQMFSRRGCPVSVRARLWCQMLNVVVTEYDRLYYEQLKSYVVQHELLSDNLLYKIDLKIRLIQHELLSGDLLYKDVKLTASNDDQYFVFEDFLYQVLLPFSRDTTILQHFGRNSASPTTAFIQGHYDAEAYRVTYPPNGVIPFHGFAMYVTPLAYLFDDPVTLYFVFRELYTRYLFRLHSISSHPQGIVSLSLLFETLLQTQEPDLFFHLRSVGCQPLKIAFKWLVRAFSGYLSSDQVLLLWDRILAYNSLEILPVLAVAIFSFRKTNLMKVLTLQAAEAVLADLTTLQVIPLTQLTLFSK